VVYARRLVPAGLAAGRAAAVLPAVSALAIVVVGGVLTARALPGVV
jgi:Cu/Ag efflux pump CusA